MMTYEPGVAFKTQIDSPVGQLTLVASEIGLRAVLFSDVDPRCLGAETRAKTEPLFRDAVQQLSEYFDGGRETFELPLDLIGTEFQVEAWRALSSVGFGETASYAQQAARIGRPKAVRAIGAANGKNPVSIVLPCHRIIGADGSLVGYGGGLDRKKFLLELEGSTAPPSLF